MKRFEVDTNFNWYGARSPAIYQSVLREMQFEPGERVLVYQDEDEWYGTVCFDETLPDEYRWFVKLEIS